MKFVGAASALFALAAISPAVSADMAVKAPVLKAQPIVCAYDILRANNQISVDFAATDMNYREFNQPPAGGVGLPSPLPQGAVINSEKNWVPGVAITASYMSDCSGTISNLYLFARGSYLSGHTDYYNNTALVGASDPAKMWDGDFRVGKGFLVSSNVMLTPYIGGGVHSWNRTIVAVPTGAYLEKYSHGYAGAGLLLQYAPTRGVVLAAYGFGGATFSSEMNFDPTTALNLALVGPNHTYSLGNSATVKAGASIDYALTDNWHVNAGVDYTYFKYGASRQELLPAFGTYEPPSRTSNVTLTTGIGYSFGGPVVARY
jgi:hypothetical protein